MSRISIPEFEVLTREELPFAEDFGFRIEHLGDGEAVARAVYNARFLRPGGTVSGPVMMGLADYVMYGAVLSVIGRVALAVTTNLNMNFLRRPKPGDVLAEARLMKLGQRLAVGEISLHTEGESALVAHATATYSIPPRR